MPDATKNYIDSKIFDTLEQQNFLNQQAQNYNEYQKYINDLFPVAGQNSNQIQAVGNFLMPENLNQPIPTSKEISQAQFMSGLLKGLSGENILPENPTPETSHGNQTSETVKNFLMQAVPMPDNYAEKLLNQNQAQSFLPNQIISDAKLRTQLGEIVGLKNLFAETDAEHKKITNAMAETDRLLTTPQELSDAAKVAGVSVEELTKQLNKNKTDLQGQLDDLNSRRDTLHKNAEVRRELFKRYGGDEELLKRYGAETTLNDALLSLNINDEQAINDLLYGEKFARSADNYFDDEYMRLRRKGYGHGDAKEIAAENTRKYQLERKMAYRQGLDLYGIKDNAINDAGMQFLTRMAEDNPEEPNSLLNAYGLPKNEFSNAFTVALAKLTHGLDMNKLSQQQLGQQILQEFIQNRQDLRQQNQLQHDADKTNLIEKNKFGLIKFRADLEKENEIFKAKLNHVIQARNNASTLNQKAEYNSKIGKIYDGKIKTLKDLMSTYEKDSAEYATIQNQVRSLLQEKNDLLNGLDSQSINFENINDSAKNIQTIKTALASGHSEKDIATAFEMSGGDKTIFRKLLERATEK